MQPLPFMTKSFSKILLKVGIERQMIVTAIMLNNKCADVIYGSWFFRIMKL